jgi:predicted RNA-binding protein
MAADTEPASYLLRIKREEVERQLYGQRILYVNIKRDWLRNTKLLFVKKATFSGSGIIDRFVSFSEIREDEKKICLENSCYGKIEFAKLVRFYPVVAVEETSVAGQNPLSLHGASLPRSDALQIEQLARARLIIL